MTHPAARHIAVNLTGMALVIALTIAGAILGLLLNGGGPRPSGADTPTQHVTASTASPDATTERLHTNMGGSVLRSGPGGGGNTGR